MNDHAEGRVGGTVLERYLPESDDLAEVPPHSQTEGAYTCTSRELVLGP